MSKFDSLTIIFQCGYQISITDFDYLICLFVQTPIKFCITCALWWPFHLDHHLVTNSFLSSNIWALASELLLGVHVDIFTPVVEFFGPNDFLQFNFFFDSKNFNNWSSDVLREGTWWGSLRQIWKFSKVWIFWNEFKFHKQCSHYVFFRAIVRSKNTIIKILQKFTSPFRQRGSCFFKTAYLRFYIFAASFDWGDPCPG